MIQRIQTLYMFLAIVMSVVCLCFPVGRFTVDGRMVGELYNLWIVTATGSHHFAPWALFVILLTTVPLSLFSIFAFHHRMIQSRLCLFNSLLLVGYYIVFIVFAFVFKDKYQSDFTVAFCAVLPLLGLIFNLLARHAVIRDDKMVRAADRIR